jgi:hypothetical protein
VFYPPTDDKSEANDLRQFAIEKTREELRQSTPKPEQTVESKHRASEILKAHQERREWKRNGTGNKKYF